MMDWQNGLSLLWMIPMMLAWLVVLGAVIYVAVRPASRDSRRR
jgi:hypothetical protein